MKKVVIAICAHAQADVVRDTIASFQQEPDCECILYDGGTEKLLTRTLGIETCPDSTPIRYARNNYRFQYEVMRYLYESKREYEFVVFAEGDMCLLKPGLYNSLCSTMSDSEFMGTDYHEVFDSPMREGAHWVVGKEFLAKWKGWKQYFPGIAYPYGCFNPGSVARKEYVDRLFQKDILREIVAHAERSPLRALEEIIWPTVAAAYARNPMRNPGSYGMRNSTHSSEEMKRYLRDPNILMLHKISMDRSAPDREFIRAAWDGINVDSFHFYPPKDMKSWHKRLISSCILAAKRTARSIQLWMADS